MKNTNDSIQQAIYDTVHDHPGGAKSLAEKIGTRAGTLNNKCDPSMSSHNININEIRKIMQTTQDHRVLYALALELNYACVSINEYDGVSDMELLNAWADWDSERGETGQAIKHALVDGDITQKELDIIEKEMFEDFQKELALLERLKQLI